MLQPITWSKRFEWLSIFVLLGSIAVTVFTGNYLFIAAPFIYLFLWVFIVNWKLSYWILLFTIPFSIQLFFLGGSLSTSIPDEPIMWLFLLLGILLYARNPKILPEWWWRNPIICIMVLQFIWLIVAVVFSKELFFSVKFLAAKTWFLVSFVVFPVFIFKEKKDYRKAFWLLLIPLLATMVFIFLRHASMQFHFRRIEKAISGIYYNHVDYSTVMSMFFPVMWVAYALSKGQKWWLRLLLFLALLFFIPAIYLTYARAAMVAVVFAIVIYAAIRLRLVKLVMPVFYGIIALLLVYMYNNNKYIEYRPNYDQTYMHFSFTDHMIATFRGTDMSSMERLYRWIAALRMSKDEPVTGYGPNAFYYYYKPYAVAMFRTYVSRNGEQSTTHNYFLYMLVEQGWPAMLLYAILVMVIFAQAQKIYYRFKDKFYRGCTMAVTMMFAAGFINNFFSELLETHKVGALFFLSIALLVVLDKKSKELAAE